MVKETPMSITAEDASVALAALHQTFASAVTDAFAKWKSAVAPTLARTRERSMASYVQDHIESTIRTQLGASPSVELSPLTSERFWLRVGHVLVRFKKMTKAFTTNNIRTQGANKFDRQLTMPGLPDVPRLTVAYQVDDQGNELLGTWVVLFRGDRVMWKYELVADAAGVVSIAGSQTQSLFTPAELKLKPTARKKAKGE